MLSSAVYLQSGRLLKVKWEFSPIKILLKCQNEKLGLVGADFFSRGRTGENSVRAILNLKFEQVFTSTSLDLFHSTRVSEKSREQLSNLKSITEV